MIPLATNGTIGKIPNGTIERNPNARIVTLHNRYLSMECILGIYVVNNR